MTDKVREYKAKDIFQDIPGDNENYNMVIPPEILKKMGWDEGTNIKITQENGQVIITEIKHGKK